MDNVKDELEVEEPEIYFTANSPFIFILTNLSDSAIYFIGKIEQFNEHILLVSDHNEL